MALLNVYCREEAAFSRLSPPLRAFLEGLTALNAWDRNPPEGYVPAQHPVVMVGPARLCALKSRIENLSDSATCYCAGH